MTAKKDINKTKSEALIDSWKLRKDYKGYDRSKGSMYNSWRAIVYTKRGRKVGFDKSWGNFDNFKNDIGDSFENGKILIRFDKTKPYSKDNCMWADKGMENMSNLIKIEYNDEILTLLEWCARFNINYNGARQRYFRGKNYTVEQILFGKNIYKTKHIKDYIEINGEYGIRAKASKMLSQYKLSDKKKGLEFDDNLTIEYMIENVFKKECVYCGSKLRIGLDRIDNMVGHVKSNIVPCCYICNTTRNNNFTHEEMFVLGNTIKDIISKRNEYKK